MMAESPWVVDVDETNFEEVVLKGSQKTPVVVDFWAEWCGPCRMLGPMLEELAEARQGGFVLAKVDVDQAQSLAGMFGVSSIPMVIAFKDGEHSLSFQGALPRPQLEEFINKLCPPTEEEEDRIAEEAFLEEEDPVAAEARYRQRLQDDSEDEAASLGLARLLIARGDFGEAKRLVDEVGTGKEQPDEVERLQALLTIHSLTDGLEEAQVQASHESRPDDSEARYQLGCLRAAAHDFPGALELLFSAGELDRELARERVREAMVAVFNAAGARSELSDGYRRKLANLLF